SELTRVVSVANAPIDQTAELSVSVWPWINPSERTDLATRILERTLRDARMPDWPATDRFFDVAAPTLSGRQLVQLATPANAPPVLVGHNIQLIAKNAEVSKSTTAYLSELTERLVRRTDNLGEAAYAAWARLLSNADPRASSTVHVAAQAFE